MARSNRQPADDLLQEFTMRYCLPLLFAALPLLASAHDKPAGFQPLFDGQSLSGWVVKGEAGKEAPKDEWLAKDGVLSAKAGHSWLSTAKTYGDFVLRLEWRVPENGNSGVFLRVPILKASEQPHVKGIEIQVLDDQGPQYLGKLQPWQYAGSIYGAV